MNQLSAEYNRFDLFDHQKEYNFLKLIQEPTDYVNQNEKATNVLSIVLTLHDTKMVYEKSLYKVFDLLGDVGGLLDLFMTFFSIVLSRYNYQLFLFTSINVLFKTVESFDSFSSFLCLQTFCSFKKSAKKALTIKKVEEKLE